MLRTAELAGVFVGHHLWMLSYGLPITPLLAYEQLDGTQQMTRLMMDDTRVAVDYGREWLAENPEHATRAVLVADGVVTIDEQSVDALIFQCRSYVEPTGACLGAVPYRPHGDARGFAIYPLQFLVLEEAGADRERLADAFFAGIARHEKAADAWDEYYQELP